MGIWNFYFIAKLFLYFGHYIGFHVVANLAFAIALVIPVRGTRLRWLRQAVAIPVGIALFFYDTFLPPVVQMIAQGGQVKGFDPAYLVDLLLRFINLSVIASLIVLYAVYHYANKWLRISTFVFMTMLMVAAGAAWQSLNIGKSDALVASGALPSGATSPPGATSARAAQPVTEEELNASLASFHEREAGVSVSFASQKQSSAPFDIIFLHVCSLAWDDLEFVKERNNALFKRFNIVFTNFNSASSYSGPASIRVLRSSCGQQKHQALYSTIPTKCETFDNLQEAGFEAQLALNHNGEFDKFLAGVRDQGVLKTAPLYTGSGKPPLQNFDGSPVYDDFSVLSSWLEKRSKMPAERVALYYNTVTLHDGNRVPGGPVFNSLESYRPRLTKMLSDFDRFLDQLTASGRRAVVVFVPEHGASIRGDKMQIGGMRVIPSPRITLVPVGVKLIGLKEDTTAKPLIVSEPSSYTAITKLLSGFFITNPFGVTAPDLQYYVRDLPSTEFVAENDDFVIKRVREQYFLRAKGTGWTPYDSSEQ